MRALLHGAAVRAALLGLALALPMHSAQAQNPPPPPPPTPQDEQVDVLRLDTDLVQLRAVVTDKNGHLVDNLTKEDFEVLEDGKPQPVSFFSVERVEGAATDAPGAGVASTRGRAPARTIVLFVDTLHMTSPTFARVKLQMRRFVDEMMTDRDSVAIVSTGGTLGILQQFMSDRRMLRRAIESLKPFGKATTQFTPTLAAQVIDGDENAIKLALIIVEEEDGYKPPPGPANETAGAGYVRNRAREVLAEEDNLRRATLQTFIAACERLAAMKGQRLMAFVSDGFTNIDREGGGDRLAFDRAVGLAARSGVVIYTVHAMGLAASVDRRLGIPQEGAQNNLRDMAGETGGKAFINTNDLGGSLQKMLEGNSVYYSLAYYPPKATDDAKGGKSDRKYRKISIRLKNHAEYSVRTQKGYMPPERRADDVATTPEEKLFKAMIAPMPVTALDVTSSAEFIEREADAFQAAIRVHIGGELAYQKSGEDYNLDCQISIAVIDQMGKVSDSFTEGFKMMFTPAQLARARRLGYNYIKRLSLKPGLYQVRVGVREVGSNLIGTSTSWVEVPNLSSGKLELSSLFLGKEEAQGGGARIKAASGTTPQPPRPKLIIGPASFKSGATAFYRFIVYNAPEPAEAAAGAAAPVVKVDVLRGEELVHEGEWQPLSPRVIRRDRKGIEAGGQIKLGLEPGFYTLRVTVKGGKSKRPVEREADFEIEGNL